MVPKIAPKGTSFKGAATYYLHDKKALTKERVEWTETRNLATDKPDLAWRVMAATALDQKRLKENAGVKATGRKSANVVLTYSLSWHPDEKEGLTKKEMLRAANDSIKAIGGEDHQAIIICHNDEPHPHVHIMLNRVSPKDGRMLSSSKEKLHLSRWAQSYEEERGKIWCEERVANNHARDVLNEFTRAAKDQPRHVHEEEAKAERAERKAPEEAQRLREEEKQRDAELSRKGRDLAEAHTKEWDALSKAHKARKRKITKAAKEAHRRAESLVQKRAETKLTQLRTKHIKERQDFIAREARLFGVARNTIDAIRRMKADPRTEKRSKVIEVFEYLTSRSARAKQVKRLQNAEVRRIQIAKNKVLRKRRETIDSAVAKRKEKNLSAFYEARKELQTKQDADNASLKKAWAERGKDRKRVWRDFRLKHEFSKSAFAKPRYDRDREYGRDR